MDLLVGYIIVGLTAAACLSAGLSGGPVGKTGSAIFAAVFLACSTVTAAGGIILGMRFGAVVDGAAAIAFTALWLRTGACWPIGMMALLFAQTVLVMDYVGGTHTKGAWIAYIAIDRSLYAGELVVLGGGPHAAALVRFLRERGRSHRAYHRNLGWVRKAQRRAP